MTSQEIYQTILDTQPVITAEEYSDRKMQYKFNVNDPSIDRLDVVAELNAKFADILEPELAVKPTQLVFNNGLKVEIKPPKDRSATITTEAAEATTMIVCLYKVERNVTFDSPDELVNTYPDAHADPKWFNTYIQTAEALNEFLGGERGFSWHHEKAGVYNSRGEQTSGTNLHKFISGLSGKGNLDVGQKDTWNPSDMYICKEGMEEHYKNRLFEARNDLRAANGILIEGITKRQLIGISLKKVRPKVTPPVTSFNVDNRPVEITYQDARTHIPTNGTSHTGTLDVIDSNGVKIQFNFRDTTATSSNISIEPKVYGAAAQLGKVPVRLALDTLSNYNIEMPTRDELEAYISTDPQGVHDRFVAMGDIILSEFDNTTFTQQDFGRFAQAAYLDQSINPRVRKVVYQTAVYFAALGKARRAGVGDEMLTVWLNLAKKKGDRFAPFIKIGESTQLIESKEGKNLHMTHVDEAHIVFGKEGLDNALLALERAMEKVLQVDMSSSSVNQKWDGAPAVYAGWNPDTGEFILALKSLFASRPKIIASEEDIQTHYGDKPELASKLDTIWGTLSDNPSFIPDGEIWQGDFLYTNDDLVKVNIDDEAHYTFQPNTILYAVKADSNEGRAIAESDVGIVWHTRYKGNTLEDMKASFDLDDGDIAVRPSVKGLWSISPHYEYDGPPTGDLIDVDEFNRLRTKALALQNKFNEVGDAYEQALEQRSGMLYQQLNAMINQYIKDGRLGDLKPDSQNMADLFEEYLDVKYSARKESYIEKGKRESEVRAVDRELGRVKELFVDNGEVREAIHLSVHLQKVLHQMKMIIMEGLNVMASRGGVIKTFLVKRGGEELEKANHEGFVIDTPLVPLKFVDREQFSRANFSDEYVKGWEH